MISGRILRYECDKVVLRDISVAVKASRDGKRLDESMGCGFAQSD